MIYWLIKKIRQKNLIKRINFSGGGVKNKKVIIDGEIECTAPNCVCIDDYVYIGPHAKLFGTGNIHIGKNSIIGNNVTILTTNHNYEGEELPYDSTAINKDVVIGRNVWIASFSFILPGVTVGDGAVVAGGSVVTKNVPACAVVGGNPAKILKYRNMENYQKLDHENKYYMVKKMK